MTDHYSKYREQEKDVVIYCSPPLKDKPTIPERIDAVLKAFGQGDATRGLEALEFIAEHINRKDGSLNKI